MSDSITVVEAKTNFAEWMNRVAYQGQRVIVERHGKPLMAWISLEDLRLLEALGNTQAVRQQRLAALALANEARQQIRRERQEAPMPDSAELLNELRVLRDLTNSLDSSAAWQAKLLAAGLITKLKLRHIRQLAQPDFEPVAISGEPIAETVKRERR